MTKERIIIVALVGIAALCLAVGLILSVWTFSSYLEIQESTTTVMENSLEIDILIGKNIEQLYEKIDRLESRISHQERIIEKLVKIIG